MLKRLLFLLTITLLASNYLFSQVTTSAITGTVKSDNGGSLPGATVTAVHTPSGTTYNTIAGSDGTFNFPNVRIGGPYTIRVTYTGQQPFTAENIFLELGQPYTLNAVLGQNAQSLETVTVTAGRPRRVISDRSGVSTNISNRQLNTLPSISRSITDFTRLTPQANGNSFGGRDSRFNNITVDGANLNNNFGLSNDALPGGGSPISIDAIEEISVNISPFDVRQANFTGANIAAITRSGDNTFRGSVYGFYRNQDFNGRKVRDFELPPLVESATKIYGARLGGPIIPNKLFFFLSYERETRDYPSTSLVPSQPGSTSGPSVSSTSIDSLKALSEFLQKNYSYNTGSYNGIPSFSSINTRILGRLDWNISNNHKLTLKYSDFDGSMPNNGIIVNGTSIPGGGINGGSYNGNNNVSITRLGNNRFSGNSYGFENSNYGFNNKVRSATAELNSRFGKFANQFLATATKVQDSRTYKGGFFPTIDFLNVSQTTVPNNQNYIHVGMDPFTPNNDVINDIYSLTNNFSYTTGKHTLTLGGSYEYQRVGNMFMPGSNSYYLYRSLNDFFNNQLPVYYAYTYSLVPGQKTVYSADLKIGQLGVYLQDEIQVNRDLRLSLGVRVDRPIYLEQPLENKAFSALKFEDTQGKTVSYSTGQFPKSTMYWSPRVGFRWDVEGNRNLVLRGGLGLFTGRIPFVFLTNIPTNSAMYQNTVAVYNTQANPNALNGYNFNANPDAFLANFPTTAGQAIIPNASFVTTNPNFKFPQVFRTSFGLDRNLGGGFGLTLEAIYTKDVNAVYMRNANLPKPNGALAGTPDTRPRYVGGANKINTNINNNIVLENTDLGHAFNASIVISKAFTRGFYGSLAYSYTFAQDVTGNPGSQASSVWNSNPNRGTGNDVELSYSQYAVPHRIVGTLSYRFEYLKFAATTLTLFYEGSHDGRYSYTYSSDINGDGNGFDLVYIPRNSSEINLSTTTINGVTYTAAQQYAILDKFIENDPYLRKHRGQVAERNGALFPWYNRVDGRLLQDFFVNVGSRRHTLQLSVDVLNLPNLINSDWGVRQTATLRNLLVPTGSFTAAGAPQFRLNTANNQPQTRYNQDIQSTSSTWGMQVGLRYIF